MKSAAAIMPSTTKADSTARKLVVGREIIISGDIASCENLVVEGTVRANIDCQDLHVEASGLFAGSAAVRDAVVFGRFEGELNVTGRLHVRAGGSIAAKVRYHELEVERGGQISGDIQVQPSKLQAAPITPLRA
jgi:cytoskeletal protein CcmA (bactofilin family)